MTTKIDKEQLELHLKHVFEQGVNFNERTIRINKDITAETFDLVDNAMTEMESHNGKPIVLKVCSEGGCVYAAMAIVGRMRRSKCRVITEGYGQIMSAATLIFAAGAVRKVSKYTTFMWHESSYDVSDRHQNTKAYVAYQDSMEHLWATWMAEFSKMPKKFYLKESMHTDKWWGPAQLIEYGLADEII